MKVELIRASRDDMKTIWQMQKEAFGGLLEKYQDHGISPASESYERIIEKYEMEGSFVTIQSPAQKHKVCRKQQTKQP